MSNSKPSVKHLFLLFCLIASHTLLGQSYSFNSQYDVDTFSVTDSIIVGSLHFNSDPSDPITDLSIFSNVTKVTGELKFTNLEIPSNSFNALRICNVLGFYNCPNQDINTFPNLDTVLWEIDFYYNTLDNIDFLFPLDWFSSGLIFVSNSNLNSLLGLQNAQDLGYSGILTIEANDSLVSLDGLNGIRFVDEFIVRNNLSLLNLDGLQNLEAIFYVMNIEANSSLHSLDFESLVTGVHDIYLFDNAMLQDISSLNNLNDINYIALYDNPMLSNCCVVNHLLPSIYDPNFVYVNNNGMFCNSLQEISINPSCDPLSLLDSLHLSDCSAPSYVRAEAAYGIPPYSYTWNSIPPTNNAVFQPASSGVYTLVVSDSLNVTDTFAIYLEGPRSNSTVDLSAQLVGSVFRPGLYSQANITCTNNTCLPASSTLQIVIDDQLTFQNNTTPAPSVSGDTLTWSLGPLDVESPDFMASLGFIVDTNAMIGDEICFEVSITPNVEDADSSNNFKTYCYDVVNSYDPNDKRAYPAGVCEPKYILKNEPIEYTIRFQNTGNAEAIDIRIEDAISENLDLTTLSLITASHELDEITIDDVRNVSFVFDSILLPDSATNEMLSQGFVTYSISPNSNLPNGTVVENTAGIFFDFNEPIITNTTAQTLVDVLPLPESILVVDSFNIGETFSLPDGTIVSETGTYFDNSLTTEGCDKTTTYELYFEQSTALNELDFATSWMIYPNPSNNQVTISVDTQKDLTLTIFSTYGELVFESSDANQLIDVTEWKSGVYLVSITDTKTGATAIRKLVKW